MNFYQHNESQWIREQTNKQTNKNENEKMVSTYRFLRVVILVRTFGKGPDNLLPIKELHIQLTKADKLRLI